jgi:hypothetical protein
VASGKNVPEKSVSGSSTKRMSMAIWPVSVWMVATYAMIGVPNARPTSVAMNTPRNAVPAGVAANSIMNSQ